MTTQEYIKKQKAYLKWIETKAIPFRVSVYNIVALQADRIFSKGINSAGVKMKSPNGGTYDSKNPLYVNQKLIKGGGKLGKPKGKNGNTKFKNGKPHKLNYVESYKDLREKLGRRVDAVTLQLNYDLFSDWAGSPKNDNFTIPKKFTPRQINTYEYQVKFSREINQEKASGLEDRYGTIFKMTKSEKDAWIKTLNFNFNFYREQYMRESVEAPTQTA